MLLDWILLFTPLLVYGIRSAFVLLSHEARWRRYQHTLPFALLLFLLMGSWGEGFSLPLLLLIEVALGVGAYLHSVGYSSLYASQDQIDPVLRKLSVMYGEPKAFPVEEEPSGFPGRIRSWAYRWRVPMDMEGVHVTFWVFPHAIPLKEQGGKWWLPVFPKGVSLLLRREAEERDMVLFPFALFPKEGFTFTGRQYVGVGSKSLEELPAYLSIEARIRHRVLKSVESRQFLLQNLLEKLPGWQGWAGVAVEGHGEADFYLHSPKGKSFFIFLQRAKDRGAKEDEAERVHRLLGAFCVLWFPEREGAEWKLVEPGVYRYRGAVQGLADWLQEQGRIS